METLNQERSFEYGNSLREGSLSSEQMAFLMADVQELYKRLYPWATKDQDGASLMPLTYEKFSETDEETGEIILHIDLEPEKERSREVLIGRCTNPEKTEGGYEWWVESRIPETDESSERWFRVNLWAGGAHALPEASVVMPAEVNTNIKESDVEELDDDDGVYILTVAAHKDDFTTLKSLLIEAQSRDFKTY